MQALLMAADGNVGAGSVQGQQNMCACWELASLGFALHAAWGALWVASSSMGVSLPAWGSSGTMASCGI